MLRCDDKGRETFRSLLVESILNHTSLDHLSTAEKTTLIAFFSQKRSPLPIQRPCDVQARLRALKKAASDARRLTNSLRLLNTQDLVLHSHEATDSANISETISSLTKTALELDTRIKQLPEDSPSPTRSNQILRALYAFPLLAALDSYGIPVNTRNDFVSISALTECKTEDTFLPDVDGNATAAMRCVMLSLHSSGTQNIDWSLAASLIKVAKPMRDQSIVNNAKCAEIKNSMTPYVDQLNYAISLTVDSFETHAEHELSAVQEGWLENVGQLPDFTPTNLHKASLH
jgi:hypothetical protein